MTAAIGTDSVHLIDAAFAADTLGAQGAARDAAHFRLRVFLVAVCWFEFERRRPQLTLSPSESARLVRDSAEAACAAVVGRLGEYRGQSRFAVWAAKFAIHETAALARRAATEPGNGGAPNDTNGGARNGHRPA